MQSGDDRSGAVACGQANDASELERGISRISNAEPALASRAVRHAAADERCVDQIQVAGMVGLHGLEQFAFSARDGR
jgi:hypothetical protein